MPILTADNRNLTNGAKYSYLNANYGSALTALIVENSEEFKPGDFILIGDFGSIQTEIRRVESITRADNTITITEETRFPHVESTKVSIISYDQVRYFHTVTATASASDPVRNYVLLGDETTQYDITNPTGTTYRYTYDLTGTNPNLTKYITAGRTIVINAEDFTAANNGTFTVTAVDTNYFDVTNATGVAETNKTVGTGYIKVLTNYQDIDTSSMSTKVKDDTNSTGFGWFFFYNSYTKANSQYSNAIPYAGFAENSVKTIIDGFLSLLSNKELKLISSDDAFSWLNEGYSIALNELNLINKNYSGSDEYDVTVTSGVQEYSLPDDFSDMLSVNDSDGGEIDPISLSSVSFYDSNASSVVKYYLRNGYIGFTPSPTSGATYTIRYTKKSTVLNSTYDSVDFPDNNFYCVKDYMMYRAGIKLQRAGAEAHKAAFFDSVNRMKIISIKRTSGNDAWGLAPEANI